MNGVWGNLYGTSPLQTVCCGGRKPSGMRLQLPTTFMFSFTFAFSILLFPSFLSLSLCSNNRILFAVNALLFGPSSQHLCVVENVVTLQLSTECLKMGEDLGLYRSPHPIAGSWAPWIRLCVSPLVCGGHIGWSTGKGGVDCDPAVGRDSALSLSTEADCRPHRRADRNMPTSKGCSTAVFFSHVSRVTTARHRARIGFSLPGHVVCKVFGSQCPTLGQQGTHHGLSV